LLFLDIMGKVKKQARKVYTPGSRPPATFTSPGPGRPRKEKKKAGFSRVGNYRSKYRPQDLERAIQAVREKRMGAREAAKHFEVPRTTLQDRLTAKSGNVVGRPTELSKGRRLNRSMCRYTYKAINKYHK
jgi:hypothetical protein